MKKNRGMAMASMVIMIIVMLIIASVSIIAGNQIILESRQQKEEQNKIAVETAISREASKYSMSGILLPGDYELIGIQNPVVGTMADGTQIKAGEDWYYLDTDGLKQLGIEGDTETYIVNYKLLKVIAISKERDIYGAIQQIEIEAAKNKED